MIRQKGFKDILEENTDLTRKYTYEEFLAGKAAPASSDITIEEAYETCKYLFDQLQKTSDRK